jgi:hypothetical protein
MLPDGLTDSEVHLAAIGGHAAVQSSLAMTWGLDDYAQIQRRSRETDVNASVGFQRQSPRSTPTCPSGTASYSSVSAFTFIKVEFRREFV